MNGARDVQACMITAKHKHWAAWLQVRPGKGKAPSMTCREDSIRHLTKALR
jgi:hypothetical protein